MAISSCKNITLIKINISLLNSMCNNTIGIDYIGVNTNDLLVGSLQCALKKKKVLGQKPNCCPMRIRNR
jgi:hypothetical protein